MHNEDKSEEVGVFQIVILVLSIIVLGALVADTAFRLPRAISGVLRVMDTMVCVVFLADFTLRFGRAESKLAFLKWGWIDLVASIPNPGGVPFLSHVRWGRVFRLFRIIRLIRALRATHKLTTLLLKNLFQTGMASIVLASILLFIFSSVGILICEQPEAQANIRTANDAVWWSVNTITTVGCPDKYPVTTEGRVLAMAVMISGVGLFGGLSGLAASFFIGNKEKGIVTEENKILARLEQLERKIDRLKREE